MERQGERGMERQGKEEIEGTKDRGWEKEREKEYIL